jgi:beta-glucosidase
LGAANNPRLIKAIGEATARAVAVTGIDWVFAPTLAVVRDDRWGRTYEGYSEDPIIVKAYAGAMVEGLQGSAGKNFLDEAHVIATAKHFLGDGGTHPGDDQGNNLATEKDLRDIDGQGYIASLHVGVQTVMASFNSWHGKKMHGNKSLLSGVLKERMGFDGLVVGDWNGHGQIDGCSNGRCATVINAGVDIIMVPDDWKLMLENTVEQVASGEIPMARIDDAVTRILRVKMRAGLIEKGAPSTRGFAGKSEYIGAQEHRNLAQQAVRESLVLLKNKGNLLPLSRALTVLVAGDGADEIGKSSGGWSLSWQGTGNTNADFPGATSIYAGIESAVQAAGGSASLSVEGDYEEKPDVAIVVFGETPYAEGVGDLANLEYQRGSKQDLELLKKTQKAGDPRSLRIHHRTSYVGKQRTQRVGRLCGRMVTRQRRARRSRCLV